MAFATAISVKKDLSGAILPAKNLAIGAKTIRKKKGDSKESIHRATGRL